ncbi:RNA polymerase subunit sigma-70 [Nonomuraea sp. NPDC050556]|uniref:RNA polymerase subunit sigma-70 n=1 Tax=Nonomuraea sp. NPDC050556 TaxID=3364369 RepID=UPI0037B588EB
MDEDFATLAEPFRRELMAHCYRMLGSVHEAEDLVQETYLRAWRGFEQFEGRASMRTWLFRIATNACLNALQHSSRRSLPSGLPGSEWIEPVPDALVDPAAIVASRAGLRLAVIAALQHLPVRQRATLVLREVVGWPSAEVAELLGTSVAAVNSMRQRAAAQLDKLDLDEFSEPAEPKKRELLDRWAAAIEDADIAALTDLLTEDAVWEMPPHAAFYAGRDHVLGLLREKLVPTSGVRRLVDVEANGQPAFAHYIRGRAHSIQVLTLDGLAVRKVTSFHYPALFDVFALPSAI